jgi:hypothetical protein
MPRAVAVHQIGNQWGSHRRPALWRQRRERVLWAPCPFSPHRFSPLWDAGNWRKLRASDVNGESTRLFTRVFAWKWNLIVQHAHRGNFCNNIKMQFQHPPTSCMRAICSRPGVEQSAFMFHVQSLYVSAPSAPLVFSCYTCAARVLQFIGLCTVVLYQYLEWVVHALIGSSNGSQQHAIHSWTYSIHTAHHV